MHGRLSISHLLVYLPLPPLHRLEARASPDIVHQEGPQGLLVVSPCDRPESILQSTHRRKDGSGKSACSETRRHGGFSLVFLGYRRHRTRQKTFRNARKSFISECFPPHGHLPSLVFVRIAYGKKERLIRKKGQAGSTQTLTITLTPT